MRFSFRKSAPALVAAAALTLAGSAFALGLQVSPTTFDFGWCPDNAMVSATFLVKNTSGDTIPLTSVQPACGCTASNFSPESLSTNEETKVGLTFNTRGYAGIEFKKSAKVKTDSASNETTVWLTGFVANPNAKLFPVGSGVVDYPADADDADKTVQIKNASDKEMTLQVIEPPDAWAKLKLSATKIAPGQTITAEVRVKGPYTEAKSTSFTLEGVEGTTVHRATVAVRTGPPPRPYKRPEAPKAPPAPVPTSVTPDKSPR
jgi:hypothetical protein